MSNKLHYYNRWVQAYYGLKVINFGEQYLLLDKSSLNQVNISLSNRKLEERGVPANSTTSYTLQKTLLNPHRG